MSAPDALRTPDDRFLDLEDFAYPPKYIDDLPGFERLRAHLVDLGPHGAATTFFCLHGEPSWTYLYRRMIPVMLESGARVVQPGSEAPIHGQRQTQRGAPILGHQLVAPDFFGFGRSDKPVEHAAYTFHFHRNFLLRLVERLDLQHITRLILMNTLLPVGEPLGPHYYSWRSQVRGLAELPVGQWMRQAAPRLTDREAAAYDAPFPDRRYQAGARMFPELAMVEPHLEGVVEAKAAMRFWAKEWSGTSFMAIGGNDPDVEAMHALRRGIRGCPGPLIVPEAGHFLPEWGEPVALAALRAFGDL